jgi:hypothetical protein
VDRAVDQLQRDRLAWCHSNVVHLQINKKLEGEWKSANVYVKVDKQLGHKTS